MQNVSNLTFFGNEELSLAGTRTQDLLCFSLNATP